MTHPTITAIEHRPLANIYECGHCTARWVLPLGNGLDDQDDREYFTELMADHVCDPFIDVERVAEVRARAEEMAAELGECPVSMEMATLLIEYSEIRRAWYDRERGFAETLVIEFDADAELLGVARVHFCEGVSVAEAVTQSAYLFAQSAIVPGRERALRLAMSAVFQSALVLDRRKWRPDHARLAVTLLDEARATYRDLADSDWVTEVSDAEAIEWLERFERNATGIL